MATTNGDLQLYKPQYSEAADIAKINDNSDVIDTAVTAVHGNLAAVQDGLAIVANGNTHAAIAANQFVYVKNHNTLAEGLYRANSAIGANAALTTSNVTADASGGLNALKGDLDTLNSNINGIKNAKGLGTASSLSALQTLLDTEAALMPTNGVEPIEVYCNPAFETIRNARYIGQLRINYNDGSRIDFTVTLTSGHGDAITIARINGAWKYTDLSNVWTKEQAQYTSGVDANSYTTAGFYSVGISTHSPLGNSTAYGVLVVFTTSVGGVQQMFLAAHNGNMFIRGRNRTEDAFSAWYKVTTTAVT